MNITRREALAAWCGVAFGSLNFVGDIGAQAGTKDTTPVLPVKSRPTKAMNDLLHNCGSTDRTIAGEARGRLVEALCDPLMMDLSRNTNLDIRWIPEGQPQPPELFDTLFSRFHTTTIIPNKSLHDCRWDIVAKGLEDMRGQMIKKINTEKTSESFVALIGAWCYSQENRYDLEIHIMSELYNPKES
jgi:hypothetical protein